MIADPSFRHVVAVTEQGLVVHDRRWRRRRLIELPTNAQVVEGRSALLVVTDESDAIQVEVRRAEQPGDVAASGTYRNWQWTFDGDKAVFAEVPEYLLLPRPGGNVLLRIADGAVLTLLDKEQGLADMTTVVALPDSRLVVLSNGTKWAVYDPKTTQAGYHSELKEPGLTAHLAFSADASVLFLCDRTSLLRLGTKDWAVKDAAGAVLEPDAAAITAWDLDTTSGSALVAHANGEVFSIDAESMEANGASTFGFAPVALRAGNGKVVAQDIDGNVVSRPIKTVPGSSTQ